MKKLTLVLFTLLTLIPHVVWGEDKEISSGTHYFLLHDDDGDVHTATFIRSSSQSIIVIPSTIGYEEKQYTVTAIGENAFSNCHELNLTIPSTITTIHENAFNGASIKNITVNNDNETYQSINDVLFTKSWKTLICYPSEKEATEYTITPDVTSIQLNAFKNCKFLQTLVFSSSFLVSETNIDFSTVKAYTESKFSIRYNGVVYYQNENNWKVGNGTAGSGLVEGYGTDITILNNVNSKKVNLVTPNAFTGRTDIYTLKFDRYSRLHETISGVDFTSMEQDLEVFAGGIRYVHVGTWTSSSSHFQVGTGTNGAGYDSSTESYSEVTIAGSINEIPVTEIADKAFIGVQNIVLTIPKSVVSLSTSTFVGIDYNSRNQLSSITVDPDNPKYKSYNGALYYYDNEKVELITYPWNGSIITRSLSDWLPGVTAIGIDAFKNHRNLTSIQIPATVKTIGQSAFQYAGYDMANLTVTFENGSELTTIGQNAFQESKVQSINLPSELTSIGASAFKQCGELTTINLPASLTTIGSSAFQSCGNFKTVNLPASLTSIGTRAFYGCNNLETIAFADNYAPGLEINDYAFYNCKLSETIEVKPGVTKIGNNAFNWDGTFKGQMKIFRVPSTVTTYGDNVVYRTVKVQRKMDLQFGSDKYLTFYSPQNIGLSDGQSDVLKAYIITGINEGGNEVLTTPLYYIHKDQALLLERVGTLPEWYDVPTSETMDLDKDVDFTTNLLKGSTTGIADMSKLAGDKYVLTGDQFVKVHQESMPAMRCYLSVDNGAQASNLYISDGSSNTFIILNEGTLVNKNNHAAVGSASLIKDGTQMKLTVTPGTNYYAYKDDITVRRNVTARSGRAPSIDNTTYDLIVDGDPDPSKLIEYTFDPQGASVFEVTVNFHKCRSLSNTAVNRTVELDPNYNYIYDGTEKEPSILSVKYDDETINAKNYTYDYLSNTNAGTGIVRITGQREYMGTYDKTFKISKRDINNVTVEPNPIPDQIFTGSEIKPALTITDIITESTESAISGNDYTINYEYNTNVTTATQKAIISIVSKEDNYTSTKVVEFNITPKTMTADDIAAIQNQDYTGSAIEPDLTIKYGKINLVKGTDYDVTYANNTNPGEAKAIVNFKGNYKGENVEKTFIINDHPQTIKVEFDNPDNQWTTYYSKDNLTLTEGLKAYVVTGRNDLTVETEEVEFIPKETPVLLYSESDKKEFNLKTCYSAELPVDINLDKDLFQGTLANLNISTVDGTKFVLFNGQFVQTAEGTLDANRCYIVVKEPIEGVTTLVIGKGISEVITLEEGQASTAGGSARVITKTDKNNNLTLVVSPKSGYYADLEDLTVVYSVNAGSARAPEVAGSKVELTPVVGYDDTEFRYTFPFTEGYFYQVTVNFHKCINFQAKETQPTITLDEGIFTYDGTEKKPKVVSVTISDGTVKLEEGRDFTVSYQNNVYAGAAKAFVTGKNHYTSTFHKDFNIAQRDINNVTVVAIPDQIYNGGEIKPVVVIKDIVQIDGVDVDLINKIEDKPDYTVEFFDNINAGTARVNINASYINYEGVKTGTTFTILPKDLNLDDNKPTIDPIEKQTYTGESVEPDIVVRDGDLIVAPDNYDVQYKDNIVEGTATAIITFKKNYKGTATTTFEIEYKKESKKLNVDFGNQDEWTTYYSPIDLTNVEGLKIYVVTGLNKGQGLDLKTEEITYIPKNIGVLLQRTDKTKTEYYGETMSSKTKLEGVTPDIDLYRGTATGIDDLKSIEGIKYILKNDNFIQVVEGALPANRCYVFISNENAEKEDITHVEGNDADGIVIQEEGESSKTAGTVNVSDVSTDGYKTITVTPASVNYATKDEIKVVRSIKNETPAASASHRVPSIENTTVEVEPEVEHADPSGTTTYKFKYDANYHYQVTVNFQNRINLSKTAEYNPVVTLKAEDIQNLVYDGKEKKPAVVSVKCNGTVVDPSNYDITYENNTNAGKPRVIITGKRFLMGSTHAEFSIGKRDFSNVTVELPIPDQEYTGSTIIPTNIVVKDIVDGQNIVSYNDFSLICENNIEVGTAKVSLAPKNNYYGVNKDYTFKIIPATGIQQINLDEVEGMWYNLNGQYIQKRPTQKGVYILRNKKGKTKKVRIK